MLAHAALVALVATAGRPTPITPRSHMAAAQHTATRLARADDPRLLSYTVDGVRVLQRLTPESPLVAARVVLMGGVRQLTPATQGIEALYLLASEYGTTERPESEWRQSWARTGARGIESVDDDWTTLGFDGLVEDFDTSWSLLADRLLAPSLARESVDRARARQRAALRRARETPDAEIMRLADSIAYRGHLYGVAVQGTDSSLATLDSAALRDYATRTFTRSRLVVVVVGDVSRERVESAVRASFGRLPAGDYVWTLPRAPRFEETAVTFVPRGLPTNYLIGVFSAPTMDSGNLLAYRWSMGILATLIDEEVRQKRGLSYAATAGVMERAAPNGYFYVTTNMPKEALAQIRRTVVELRSDESLDADLRFGGSRRESLGFLFQHMTVSAQADALLESQLLLGDHRLADRDVSTAQSVSGAAIRRMLMAHVRNIRFIYAGDTTRIARREFEKF